MSWPGEITITGEGKLVSLGTTVAPSKATFKVDGLQGGPDAVVRFEVRDGRPECVEIVVKSRPGGRGIRTEDMGLFNIGTLAGNVFAEVGIMPTGRHAASEDDRWAVRGDVVERRSGRHPSEEELKQVAETYRTHIATAPVKAVQELLLYPSMRTASRRVLQAREAGFLTDADQAKKRSK